MSMMTPAQARVVDPVLSGLAQGYRQQRLVGNLLFPTVPVLTRGGKVIEFDTAAFERYNSSRAPGASARRITFGYQGKPYSLEGNSLDAVVPMENMQEAQAVPGIDLGSRAVKVVLSAMTLGLECEQAAIAANPANYDASHQITLSGGSKWSDHVNSDPAVDIATGIEAIAGTTGMDPNVLILGRNPYKALKTHPKVIERLAATAPKAVTTDLLATLFDIENVVVGKAVVWVPDTSLPEGGSFQPVWGDIAVLAYAPQEPGGNEEPSFGYTYTLEGNPNVLPPFWHNDSRSWVYPVNYDRAPVLTGMTAGYLINGAS